MKKSIFLLQIASSILLIILLVLNFKLIRADKIFNPDYLFYASIYGFFISITLIISVLHFVKALIQTKQWRNFLYSFLSLMLMTITFVCSIFFGSSSAFATITSQKNDLTFKLISELCITDNVYRLVANVNRFGLVFNIIGEGQISYSEDGSLINNEKLELSQNEKYLAIIRGGYMTDIYDIEKNEIVSDSSYYFSFYKDSSTWKHLSDKNWNLFKSDN